MCISQFELQTNVSELRVSNLSNIKTLVYFIRRNKYLKTLSLEGLKLSLEHMRLLCRALKESTSLRTLNLANTLDASLKERSAWIFILKNYLEADPPLKSLDISANGICANQISILLPGFSKVQSLNILNLANNFLHGEGLKLLATWLKTNSSMIELNLNNNWLYEKHLDVLLEVLETNKTLQIVHVEEMQLMASCPGNEIVLQEKKQALQSRLQHNEKLQDPRYPSEAYKKLKREYIVSVLEKHNDYFCERGIQNIIFAYANCLVDSEQFYTIKASYIARETCTLL